VLIKEAYRIARRWNFVLRRRCPTTCPTSRRPTDRIQPTNTPPTSNFFRKGSSSTAAGLLARYLLQEWYVDVNQCTLTVTGCKKSSRSGRTIKVTLTTRDQLGRQVHCPLAEIELIMIRSQADDYRSRGDVEQPHCPQQQVPYKPTYLNKARYMSLTMMSALRDISAEELRYAHYKNTVHSRTLPVRSNLGRHLREQLDAGSGRLVQVEMQN
ncbi:conserved hypothetical protein, partial [Trichinella spiralis]|uniref:hypothetical protein n=1 Tax=Trichinella spiralis TaxID=6334 RepID=UPI0001EFD4B7